MPAFDSLAAALKSFVLIISGLLLLLLLIILVFFCGVVGNRGLGDFFYCQR